MDNSVEKEGEVSWSLEVDVLVGDGKLQIRKMPGDLFALCMMMGDITHVSAEAFGMAKRTGQLDDLYRAPADRSEMVWLEEKEPPLIPGNLVTEISARYYDNNVVVVNGIPPNMRKAGAMIGEILCAVLKRWVDEIGKGNVDEIGTVLGRETITATARNLG
jgi:hypothetical protein